MRTTLTEVTASLLGCLIAVLVPLVVIVIWWLSRFYSDVDEMRRYNDYATSYATEYSERDRTAAEVCPGGTATPQAERDKNAHVLWCLEIGNTPGGAAAVDAGIV